MRFARFPRLKRSPLITTPNRRGDDESRRVSKLAHRANNKIAVKRSGSAHGTENHHLMIYTYTMRVPILKHNYRIEAADWKRRVLSEKNLRHVHAYIRVRIHDFEFKFERNYAGKKHEERLEGGNFGLVMNRILPILCYLGSKRLIKLNSI